ncbi:RNA 2'-phosphotransferase [Nonomuraea dietziae]|uniref:RNA 2'-phosphotransferase n=1 Tax=Nonomuraea dietziae TaxID=65515 RepID=UPI003372BD06
MSRQYVHLSADRDTAVRVGARRGVPVVLVVAAGEMHEGGHEFRVSANGVWLVAAVPPASSSASLADTADVTNSLPGQGGDLRRECDEVAGARGLPRNG